MATKKKEKEEKPTKVKKPSAESKKVNKKEEKVDEIIESVQDEIVYGPSDCGKEMAQKDDETYDDAKALVEKVIDATIGKDIVGIEPSAETDEIEIIPGVEDDSFQTVIHGEVHPHIPEHLLKKEAKEEKQKIKKEWLSPKRIYRWMGQIIDL